MLLTTFRVLSLAFTLSLIGLTSLPVFFGLILLLILVGVAGVVHKYEEKWTTYIKTKHFGLFTLALSSMLTTTGRRHITNQNILGPFAFLIWKTNHLCRMDLCFKAMSYNIQCTFAGDEKQPELQFQLFWLCANLVLTTVLGSLAILQPSCLPTLYNNQDHLLQSNIATGVVMATILATGLLSFVLFFFSIKSGLESTMVEPSKKKQQSNEELSC